MPDKRANARAFQGPPQSIVRAASSITSTVIATAVTTRAAESISGAYPRKPLRRHAAAQDLHISNLLPLGYGRAGLLSHPATASYIARPSPPFTVVGQGQGCKRWPCEPY